MVGKTINVPASQAGDMEHAMSPLWDWVKLTQRNVPAAGWETFGTRNVPSRWSGDVA